MTVASLSKAELLRGDEENKTRRGRIEGEGWNETERGEGEGETRWNGTQFIVMMHWRDENTQGHTWARSERDV